MAMTDTEKLRVIITHWMEHNEEHGKEFTEWAQRAKSLGKTAVHDEIQRAVAGLHEVNRCLGRALEDL